MKSYIAHAHAKKGTLVGGVIETQSSRFGLLKDAETRAESLREYNPNADIWVSGSMLLPEIFPHCKTSTAIGCICPECKVKITKKHAKEFVEHETKNS